MIQYKKETPLSLIEDLNFNYYEFEALRSLNVETFGELMCLPASMIMMHRNTGKRTCTKLQDFQRKHKDDIEFKDREISINKIINSGTNVQLVINALDLKEAFLQWSKEVNE